MKTLPHSNQLGQAIHAQFARYTDLLHIFHGLVAHLNAAHNLPNRNFPAVDLIQQVDDTSFELVQAGRQILFKFSYDPNTPHQLGTVSVYGPDRGANVPRLLIEAFQFTGGTGHGHIIDWNDSNHDDILLENPDSGVVLLPYFVLLNLQQAT